MVSRMRSWLFLASAIAFATPAAGAQTPSALVGRWTGNETGPAAAGQATMEFTRTGAGLSGTMRLGGETLPLFEVSETGNQVAFTTVIPGTPYVTVHYTGAVIGD